MDYIVPLVRLLTSKCSFTLAGRGPDHAVRRIQHTRLGRSMLLHDVKRRWILLLLYFLVP
ncbi:hypothetical protein E4U54_006960, partial [Claviceps lovelessii]